MKHFFLLPVLAAVALSGCIDLFDVETPEFRVYYQSGDATSGLPPSDTKKYVSGSSATVLGSGTLEYNDYSFLGWRYETYTFYTGEKISINYSDINLYPVWDDGLDGPFVFEIKNGEAIITAYTEYTYDYRGLVIPETLQGKPVTTIGKSALSNIAAGNVTLSKNLKHIGVGAFAGNGIEFLNIPPSVETIAVNAFRDNALTRIVITAETSLREIAAYAFAINKLEHVDIPDSIKTIGLGAFHENPLFQITIGSDVTIQDDDAFGVNGASFRAFYNAEKKGGLYIHAGDDIWQYFDDE